VIAVDGKLCVGGAESLTAVESVSELHGHAVARGNRQLEWQREYATDTIRVENRVAYSDLYALIGCEFEWFPLILKCYHVFFVRILGVFGAF
jgi:hypothetical protein